jgi:hypothetical protein
MNRNTFVHAVAAVNEVLMKQAAMNKQAAGKWQATKDAVGKAYGATKGFVQAHPNYMIPAGGAALGALGGGLYGGFSEDGSVPMGMLTGAAGGGALAGAGLGGYRAFQNRDAIKAALQNYFAGNVANGAMYADPRLGMAALGGLAGAGAGYAAGDGWGAGIGGVLGAGAGYGGARFGMPRANKALNNAAANMGAGGPPAWARS